MREHINISNRDTCKIVLQKSSNRNPVNHYIAIDPIFPTPALKICNFCTNPITAELVKYQIVFISICVLRKSVKLMVNFI